MTAKILLGVAALYVAISGFFFYSLNDKISSLQAQQTALEQQQQKKMNELNAQMKADRETLASQVGMTEKELNARSAELRRSQAAAESRLVQQQTAVSTVVSGVQTDVTAVKSDVALTKSDLEATKAKLEHAIGDLGLQSGLIAHTRDARTRSLAICRRPRTLRYRLCNRACGREPGITCWKSSCAQG